MIGCLCRHWMLHWARFSPTGSNKKDISVLGWSCKKCGRILPGDQPLAWHTRRWVERWNRRMRREEAS